MFESTIAQAAVLAAFMPIVAGQGGNAGTQTMTIVVRSLALKEIEPSDTWWAIWHELRIGIINGVTVGLLVALIAWFWKGNPYLGSVIGLAMLGNLVVAALAGDRADDAQDAAHRSGAGVQHFCDDLHGHYGLLAVFGAGNLFFTAFAIKMAFDIRSEV